MITTVTLEFGEKSVQIVVRMADTHRVVEAVADGVTLVSRAAGEGEVDAVVTAMIDELTVQFRASTLVSHTVHHGRDTFEIEVWRVGRAFKSCVKIDGQIIDGVMAWNDFGVVDRPEEIARIHEQEIRSGSVARPVPKDYFR